MQAPREDGQTLFEPAPEQTGELIADNVALREGRDYDVQGRPLGELIRRARIELLHAARRYTAGYRDIRRDAHGATERPILLAGHQPELFHPGVWLKNFALGRLAECHGATAVNLLIDNDTLRETTVRVPSGSRRKPRFVSVAFDRPGPVVPYEQRSVLDWRLFRRFGDQAAEQIAPFVGDPLVEDYWPLAVARAEETGNLGLGLAQARHLLEDRWGLETLEVPQSVICGMESFRWLLAHLLANLPRLIEVYNDVVHEYRRRHGIRGQAHPVPDLSTDGGWLEAPFWVWTANDPRRRALLARYDNDRIELGDGSGLRLALPLTPEGNAADAVDRLGELAARGVKIRSRALTTTLWARLALGDLFIHGIGGAKYDELTDTLIERFFDLKPPRFMVASATLHVVGGKPRADARRIRDLKQQLRRLTYQPERFLGDNGQEAHTGGFSPRGNQGSAERAAVTRDGRPSLPAGRQPDSQSPTSVEHERVDDSVEKLRAEKARLLATPQTAENARWRCRNIRRVNELLQPYVDPLREETREQLRAAEYRCRADRVLRWRELAFCLHSRERIRDFLSQALPIADAACSNNGHGRH